MTATESPGLVVGFVAAAIRVATPLLLAATGETVTELAGVINLSIEGGMLAGALASAIAAAAAGQWAGVGAAALVGALVAATFGACVVGARVNQIVAGTAVTLACVGATGAIYRQSSGAAGAGVLVPTLGPLPVPGLSAVPGIGPTLFSQSGLTYLALALVALVWWGVSRTRWGLRLRATGEGVALARAAGVPVLAVRFWATVFGGTLAGLAGASLVLGQVGAFAERMTAGRGYVAIAIVVVGRWHPGGVALAALLFGGATALQFAFQSLGLAVPYQLFLMLPYLLTLLALAGVVGRARSPAGLGADE